VRRRLAAGAVVALVVATAAPVRGEADLVAEGAGWWRVSPDPGNPVACATCHHDPETVRGWAASFPKVRPLPPPHARVMTLLQANAEAVSLHYRLPDPRRAATAITAYLTQLAAGLPVTPGIAAGQPVFAERLARLAASVKRGEALFGRRCAGCHRPADAARPLTSFPRWSDGRAESVESFLEDHHPRAPRLRWDAQPVADLVAALAARLRGRPIGKETP
jgi:mono/diheme cytochrome c family protein